MIQVVEKNTISLGLVSTLTKQIMSFFKKNNSFLKFEIIEFFIIYYDIVT